MIRRYIEEGKIVVEPYDKDNVQPASLDVRLDRRYIWLHQNEQFPTDVIAEDGMIDDEGLLLMPGEFILCSTVERFEIPSHVVARIEGKSSLGRQGLLIHSTAGFVDPGFRGQLTLEISTLLPISLEPDMLIGQVAFHRMAAPVHQVYRGKYQDQEGPTDAR
jgi:dCTP deaminase